MSGRKALLGMAVVLALAVLAFAVRGPADGGEPTPVVSPRLIGCMPAARLVGPIGWKASWMSMMPIPKVLSGPGAPTSCAVTIRISTISAPVRAGKACASSATAPAICGAEKLVPAKRYEWPLPSTYIESPSK